jgi:DNA-directed RNA polymerase subunit F
MSERSSKTIFLTDEQRAALEAVCRRRKVDALVLKRARASLLLASGYDSALIYEILDIGPAVLMDWRFASADCRFSA